MIQRLNSKLFAARGDHRCCAALLTLCAVLVACTGCSSGVLTAAPANSSQAPSEPARQPQTIEGQLISVSGTGPVLKTAKKQYSLAAKTSWLFHTLEDQRLLNKGVRVEGTMRPDGNFEVSKLFTIHDGKLYKVRYWCETCHIAALEPGNCVCCQHPTELQEIPLSELPKE